MGSKHERHARSRWEWGTQPSRSDEQAPVIAEQLAGDPDHRRPPAKKNTTSWCRGKSGRPHRPVLVHAPYVVHSHGRDEGCHWQPAWDADSREWKGATWYCEHREECEACGKVLTQRLDIGRARCPDFKTADPEQKAAAEAKAARLQDAYLSRTRSKWMADSQRRKKARLVQMGVSGFRQKRSAGT